MFAGACHPTNASIDAMTGLSKEELVKSAKEKNKNVVAAAKEHVRTKAQAQQDLKNISEPQNKNPGYANALERAMHAASVSKDPAAAAEGIIENFIKATEDHAAHDDPVTQDADFIKKAGIVQVQRYVERIVKEPKNRLRDQKYKLVRERLAVLADDGDDFVDNFDQKRQAILDALNTELDQRRCDSARQHGGHTSSTPAHMITGHGTGALIPGQSQLQNYATQFGVSLEFARTLLRENRLASESLYPPNRTQEQNLDETGRHSHLEVSPTIDLTKERDTLSASKKMVFLYDKVISLTAGVSNMIFSTHPQVQFLHDFVIPALECTKNEIFPASVAVNLRTLSYTGGHVDMKQFTSSGHFELLTGSADLFQERFLVHDGGREILLKFAEMAKNQPIKRNNSRSTEEMSYLALRDATKCTDLNILTDAYRPDWVQTLEQAVKMLGVLGKMTTSNSHAASLSIQATADLEDDDGDALALLHFRVVLASTFPAFKNTHESIDLVDQ